MTRRTLDHPNHPATPRRARTGRHPIVRLMGCLCFACALLAAGFHTPAVQAAESSTMEELKANYLTSIYDDCRIFLEGIELFINRDYPRFWSDISTGKPVSKSMIQRYIRELEYFEGQLDALYEEFISYADTTANKSNHGQTRVRDLEAKIYQILAYAYMRTGDFAMSHALTANEDIITREFTIPLMDIEGKKQPFALTRELKRLQLLISANLEVVEIRMTYFFPSDLDSINAYLKVDEYDGGNPFNLTFLSYYDNAFLELGDGESGVIHFSEIIRFFNRMKYNDAFSQGIDNTSGREQVYRLPIIKGQYGMALKDDAILGYASPDNTTLGLERLCRYTGFTRTDFRTLKLEEKKNITDSTTEEKELYISRVESPKAVDAEESDAMTYYGNVPSNGELRPGSPIRYGTYRLFEGGEYLGLIELVPCYKGQHCAKQNPDKAVTEVKVYNHELSFYEDTLDYIRMNTRMYGTARNITRDDASEIHIGRGCASGKR
ncbi:hypothetical protein [Desulfoluna butyratoxydans]|uniref:Uncharacterized protein n=1 Tax=Desulfoluna butyratoxydans TaxID=231438 RepID=A0A4U8YS92_9BACT|nr:hypothetical protein [Desulfoluna butyratoxydans]VFQ46624.1 hypothetical protein MSL71_42940 [Desulfoluna butyratoxydans]